MPGLDASAGATTGKMGSIPAHSCAAVVGKTGRVTGKPPEVTRFALKGVRRAESGRGKESLRKKFAILGDLFARQPVPRCRVGVPRAVGALRLSYLSHACLEFARRNFFQEFANLRKNQFEILHHTVVVHEVHAAAIDASTDPVFMEPFEKLNLSSIEATKIALSER